MDSRYQIQEQFTVDPSKQNTEEHGEQETNKSSQVSLSKLCTIFFENIYNHFTCIWFYHPHAIGYIIYKAILCVFQASKKKVYMLHSLDPDRSVTGGAWYSDHDFESEFVEVLNQQCFKYLEQRVCTVFISLI